MTHYNSISEAARALNIDPGRISEYFSRNHFADRNRSEIFKNSQALIGFIFAFIFILFFAETFYYCSSDDLLLTLFVSLPPVKTYSNAEADKAKILQENQNFAAGIYCFTNLIKAKQYVGSGKDLSKRLAFYFSEAQMNYVLKRSQSQIYSAILKHGLANFSLSILEYCEVEMCREREGYFIKSARKRAV